MTGKSKLSDDQWRALYKRAIAGEKLADLDREIGHARGGVRRVLTRRFGYAARPKADPMTWEQSDAIHERVQRGESLGTIARELGWGTMSGNLYRLMANRYGYKSADVRYRPVWAQTVDLSRASDTDLAYIAGIIDGEGSVMRVFRNRKYPVWVVKVNMTDRPVIEWLHSFGGKFSVRPSRDPGRLKEQYEWKLHRQLDVQAVLTAIVPYMRVKKDLAEQALATLCATDAPMRCDWTAAEAEISNSYSTGRISAPESSDRPSA